MGLMPAHMDYLKAVDLYWCLQFIIQVANAFKCKHEKDVFFSVMCYISENLDIYRCN